MKNTAIILASGTGERSGLNRPKQFFEVGGKTLLEHSISAFEKAAVDEIIIVSHPDFTERTKELAGVHKVVTGGTTRQESSYNGVLASSSDNVLIHDAVRAFITPEIISKCIEGLKVHDAVCTAIETSDTILEVATDGRIINVPKRQTLRCAQTPQCFKRELIKHAHELALSQNQTVTDDCGLILANNLAEIYVIQGSTKNRKITYPEDLAFAKFIYERK